VGRNNWSHRLFEQEHVTNDRTGNNSGHFDHHSPFRLVQNPHLDPPGTCSAMPIEKGQSSTTAFRAPASEPPRTTLRLKRRKIDYLTEIALKELGISNGTHLACESIQSTLGIRYTCICEEKLCFDTWCAWVRHTTSKAHKDWADCAQNTAKAKTLYCDLCNLICKDCESLVEHFETSIYSDRRAWRRAHIANIEKLLAKGIRVPSKLLYPEEGANNTVTAFEAAFTEQEPGGTHTPATPPSRDD
jgi:hypothetical protein